MRSFIIPCFSLYINAHDMARSRRLLYYFRGLSMEKKASTNEMNIIIKETGSKTLNIDNRLVMYVYLRFNIYSVNSDISCG